MATDVLVPIGTRKELTMLESLQNYTKLCDTVGREPDCAEFMAWAYLRIEPDWYKELINV